MQFAMGAEAAVRGQRGVSCRRYMLDDMNVASSVVQNLLCDSEHRHTHALRDE